MDKFGQFYEQIRVHANELVDKVTELIHEGEGKSSLRAVFQPL